MAKSRAFRAKRRHERNALLAARARVVAESEQLREAQAAQAEAEGAPQAVADLDAADEELEFAADAFPAERRFLANDDPPFDPPQNDNIFGDSEGEDDAGETAPPQLLAEGDGPAAADPPFDAPDEDDEIFGKNPLSRALLLEEEARPDVASKPPPQPPSAAFAKPSPAPASGWQAAPPIAIHASWDRAETAELLNQVAADARMARARMSIGRGGFDGAIVRLEGQECPNLLIIDTTLRPAELLAGLDRMTQALDQSAKVIVIGALNDVRLLRELSSRGVDEYIVAPLAPDDLIKAICRLYDVADESRVIAVMGARGGVGASTIAQNIAWSIAERQGCGAALVDLDLPFGSAALHFAQGAKERSLGDLLADHCDNERDLLEAAAVRPSPRLSVLAAAADLCDADIDAQAIEALIARVRRTSPYVVLDLPHAWTHWVKHVLRIADDVLIVATPDLASLRDSKNLADALKEARKQPPLVALSMVGAPKRPEIRFKDFTEALGAAPVAAFAFDAALYGACAMKGRMVGEAAPASKAAQTIDALAAAFTGRPPLPRKAVAPDEGALELVHEAPLEEAYLVRARAAAAVGAFAQSRVRQEPKPGTARGQSLTVRLVGALAACAALIGLLRLEPAVATAAPPPAAAAAPSLPPLPAPTRAEKFGFVLRLFEVGRAREGVLLLARMAEAGYAPAQYRLAKAYELGEGIQADLALARHWTERAAIGGNARAMHDLGVFYARGEGAPVNEAAAYRWFRQAADFGLADSQYNLGVLYERGRGGVSADGGEALFWFLLAAAQGDAAAAARARAIEPSLTVLQLEQARARAQAFRPRPLDPVANAGASDALEAPR